MYGNHYIFLKKDIYVCLRLKMSYYRLMRFFANKRIDRKSKADLYRIYIIDAKAKVQRSPRAVDFSMIREIVPTVKTKIIKIELINLNGLCGHFETTLLQIIGNPRHMTTTTRNLNNRRT